MALKQQKLGGNLQFPTTGGLSVGGLGGNMGGGLGIGGLGQQQPNAGGFQLGGSTATGLGGLASGMQAGGLQLGKPSTSIGGGLQLGQLGGLQSGGLQIGQQTAGLQMNSGQLGQGGGLKLGATPQAGLGTQASGLQGGLVPQQQGGLQMGGLKGSLHVGQTAPVASGLQLGKTTQPSLGMPSLSSGLSQPQPLTQLPVAAATTVTALPRLQATASSGLKPGQSLTTAAAPQLSGLPASSAGSGIQLTAIGLPGPTQTAGLPTTGLKLGGLTSSVGTTTGIGGLNTLATASQPASTGTLAGGLKLGGGLVQTGTTTASSGTTTSLATGGTSVKGLGGVDPSTLTGKSSKNGPTSVMDTKLPDVLNQLVAGYEQFIKTQKEKSDEISKFSDSGLNKVKQDTVLQEQALATVSSHIAKDSQIVGFLKNETSEELMHAEVAQRTQELPAGLQHENTAPDMYFQKLVASFETKMVLYRREIEELESHLSAIATDTGTSPQNIVEILQLQYKPFLLLAAQLQTTHEHVQKLKEQYLTYRRVVLQDPTDIFEERKKAAKKDKTAEQVPTGPSPFSSTVGQMTSGLTAYPTAGATGLGTGLGGMGGQLKTSVGFNPSGLSMGTGVGGLNIGSSASGSSGYSGSGLKLGNSLAGGLSSMSQPTLSTLGSSGSGAVNPLATGAQPFTLQRPPLGKRKNG